MHKDQYDEANIILCIITVRHSQEVTAAAVDRVWEQYSSVGPVLQ